MPQRIDLDDGNKAYGRAPHLLLIGATGVFGSLLARDCAAIGGLRLTLAARSAPRLQALAQELGCAHLQLDRHDVTAAQLKAAQVTLVVDAAGPFQEDDGQLIRSCIAAGIDYIDLADDPDFVISIDDHGNAAVAADVAVITGASSTPALSHAALRNLIADWRHLDAVEVAICPGNDAPRGLSVMQAVLTWVGQPLRVFTDAGWRIRPGWSNSRRIAIPGLGTRPAALADTPDRDLLESRFKPRLRAEMRAGLELGIMHHGLALLGWLVRLDLIRDLRPLARPLKWLAECLRPFGSDEGAMIITATGRDAEDAPCKARWWLIARDGRGPHIPTLPALAMVRRHMAGSLPCGAHIASDLLELAELQADFTRLGLEEGQDATPLPAPLFARALGPAFDKLPETERQLHSPRNSHVLHGQITITSRANPLGRLIARLLGFPGPCDDAPLSVTIEAKPDGSEIWHRHFPDCTLQTRLQAVIDGSAIITETISGITTTLELRTIENGLSWHPVTAHIGPVPLPRWLLPRVSAREWGCAKTGHHRMDIDIALPLIGHLTHYKGWLMVPKS